MDSPPVVPLKGGSKEDEVPLHLAVMNRKDQEVSKLLEAHADPEARQTPFGWSALQLAAGGGCVKSVNVLLEHSAKVDARANDGEQALHLAAAEGHTRIIQLLVNARAELCCTNDDGETPLHVAVQHVGAKPGLGHIRELLALRADPSVKDKQGHSVFDQAGLYTNRREELRAALGGAPAPSKDPDDPWPDTPGELPESQDHTEVAESLRLVGNARFKEGKYEEALKFYFKAKMFLPTGPAAFDPVLPGDEAAARARACSLAVGSNAAACELKLGKYEACVRRCDTILSLDSRNVKVLYRKAVALRALGDTAEEDAQTVLIEALALSPEDAAIKRELADLAKLKRKESATEKRLAQKMFSS